ncbi:Os01g0717501 [Oryza sativa Japonica Group]|uniref:Os01g0717501 protein n=1 Tax=Oryza sativa subsp. japonica TaxID=39947 RepID=A0A0P0V7F3_ORYSJ|nr:hypothetical protein EE612_005357 [Oryza sativa]BAS74044.1 Os01g0717501 [Oryza sativa Japonica Group]
MCHREVVLGSRTAKYGTVATTLAGGEAALPSGESAYTSALIRWVEPVPKTKYLSSTTALPTALWSRRIWRSSSTDFKWPSVVM